MEAESRASNLRKLQKQKKAKYKENKKKFRKGKKKSGKKKAGDEVDNAAIPEEAEEEMQAATVAALIGGTDPGSAYKMATDNFRAIPLCEITKSDLDSNQDTNMAEKTEEVRFGEVAAFITHGHGRTASLYQAYFNLCIIIISHAAAPRARRCGCMHRMC